MEGQRRIDKLTTCPRGKDREEKRRVRPTTNNRHSTCTIGKCNGAEGNCWTDGVGPPCTAYVGSGRKMTLRQNWREDKEHDQTRAAYEETRAATAGRGRVMVAKPPIPTHTLTILMIISVILCPITSYKILQSGHSVPEHYNNEEVTLCQYDQGTRFYPNFNDGIHHTITIGNWKIVTTNQTSKVFALPNFDMSLIDQNGDNVTLGDKNEGDQKAELECWDGLRTSSYPLETYVYKTAPRVITEQGPEMSTHVQYNVHKMFDYNEFDNTMTGITSITMLSALEMFNRNNNKFSYVLYANKEDCKREDLWANALDNHVIICINNYNESSHWFCMGRYLVFNDHTKKEHEYFMYCSCNIVDVIFKPFVQCMYYHLQTLDKLPTLRAPIVENQLGGNYCGFWVLLLCYFIAINDLKKIRQYFMKKVSEQEMLRLCRNFIINK